MFCRARDATLLNGGRSRAKNYWKKSLSRARARAFVSAPRARESFCSFSKARFVNYVKYGSGSRARESFKKWNPGASDHRGLYNGGGIFCAVRGMVFIFNCARMHSCMRAVSCIPRARRPPNSFGTVVCIANIQCDGESYLRRVEGSF